MPHWMKVYNTKTEKKLDQFFEFCYKTLGYMTEKKSIEDEKTLNTVMESQQRR